jgi:CRISPR-associated protein Cas5 subtype I-B
LSRNIVFFSEPNHNSQLAELLERHETIFTPYLGTSTMIANFSYLGTFEYTSNIQDLSELSSILPYKVRLPAIAVERGISYAIEQDIPGRINENRELLSSYSAIYNPDGLKIKVKNMLVNSFESKGSRQNFVFLPS